MATAAEDGPVRVVLLPVLPQVTHLSSQVRAEQGFRYSMEGIDYSTIETKVVVGDDVLEAGLAIAAPGWNPNFQIFTK